jgi:hypothetical protein
MDLDYSTAQLRRNAAAINALIADIEMEQARWRPADGMWAMIEVVSHLVDEETDDFRLRVGMMLEDPNRVWPPIDPERWVTERKYIERDLPEMAAAFRRERAISLEWLGSLVDPDWNSTRVHPTVGPITSGDLLASWIAHDLFHLRQLMRLQWEYLAVKNPGRSTGYAGGEW